MSDPQPTPTFTPEEVFQNVNDPRFHQLPAAKRAQALNAMLDSAHDDMSAKGDWTPARQKAWGEFASHLQEKSAPGLLEKTGDFFKGLPGVVTSMAKDAGAFLITASDVMGASIDEAEASQQYMAAKGIKPVPPPPVKGAPTLPAAFAQAEAGNALDWFGWIGEGVSGGDIGGGHSNEDAIRQRAALASLQKSINAGEVPIGNRDKLKAWMDDHAKDLPALNDPDNAPLLASYLKTRSPDAWDQLSTNLTLNAVQATGKKMVKDAIQSTGAEELPESLRDHLASAADPVNQLMLVAPFLHGAKAVQAVTAATRATQIGMSALEQGTFGAAQHMRDHPQAGALDILGAGLEQGLTGAALTGAHMVVGGTLKAGANALAKYAAPRPQGRVVLLDGQTYHQTPQGEWRQVQSIDSEGNMFVPLDPNNPEHAAAIDLLNDRAAAQEAPATEAPAAVTDPETPPAAADERPPAAPVDDNLTLPPDPNLPTPPPASEAPPAAVAEPPLDENAVPTDQTPPAAGAGDAVPPEDPAPPEDHTPPAAEPTPETDEPPPPAEGAAEPPAAAVVGPAPVNGTATKNAVMEAERADRGEPPIVKQAARDWGEAWDHAVATAAADPTAGARLVDAITTGDKTALDDQENALLLHEKIQKRKLVRDLVNEANNAPPGTAGDLRSRLAVALEELTHIDEATRKAGSETGRGLNARKMMRDEDNNLESMLATYRASKGADLTEGEMNHVIDIHQDLDAAAKAMDGHQETRAHQAAQEAIARMQAGLREEMAARAEAAKARLQARAERASQTKPLRYRDKLPDRSDNVDWDTVDFIRSEGGLKRPPPRKVNTMGQVEGAHGEHNALRRWAKDSPSDYGAFTNDAGREIDVAAQDAHNDGLIDEPTPDALMAKLQEDIATRRRGRDEARANDKAMAEEERAAMRESTQLDGEQRASERAQSEAGVPLADQARNFFQEARQKARARLDADQTRLHADPLGFQFFRSTLDHVIIGASHLAEGAVDFAQWGARMAHEFGEGIRPHLESLYEKSRDLLDQTQKDFKDRAEARARAATPQGVMERTIDRMSRGRLDAVNFDPKIAQEFAKAHVAAGVTDVHELTAKVHADLLQLFPELTPRDVRDAISGYGRTTSPSKDQLKQQMREIRAQGRLVSALEDARMGKSPLKSGFQRGKPTDAVRELATKVKDMMRKMGIETDGPRQLANAREAVINRLQNQIDDLHREMQGKKQPRDAREHLQYDDEMNALKKERDELQKYMDDLTGPNAASRWNQQAERAAKASAENYRRRIAQGDLERPAGQRHEPNERTQAAMTERDAAKSEWDRLREASGIPQAEALDRLKAGLVKRIGEIQERIAGKAKPEAGKPVPLDAEARMLKFEHDRLQTVLREMEKTERPGVSDAQRADAATRATEKAIAEIEKELATGQRPAKKTPTFVPDARLRALKAELESLRGIRDAAREAQIPRRSPEQVALDSLKKRLKTNTDKLAERLKNGDFDKTPRKKVALDTEGLALRDAYERKKLEFDREVEKQRLKNRPAWEKAMDTTVRWRRGFLLTGYHTLAKLSSAAVLRLGITPLEEGIGGLAAHLPLIGRIAAAAPREGGFSLKAESSALADGFTHTMKEAWNILRTGKSDLDMDFGKRHFEDLNPSVIDFFGHLHALLKSPAKMAEFHRSFQKRAEFLMRHGVDVHDPVIQEIISKDAYLDANRAIFMQDNLVTSAFENAMNSLENNKAHPLAGKALATVARTLLPIVKVPTNIAFETAGSYVMGLPRAAVELAGLLHRGLDTMKPEEADAFMRHLKKGSLGAGMILLGFCNPALVGGYRQENDKRKPGDVGPEDVKVGGTTVSHTLLHTPALNALQLGATMARVSQDMVREHGHATGQTKGLTTGAMAGALGLLKEVPFLNDTTGIFRGDHEGDYQRHRYLQSLVVPLGIKQAAEDLDPTKRRMNTYTDALKAAIPGARETLPAAKATRSHR